MCNINWGDDYCINHLFWVTITMYFTFLVDILLEFVNMSKKGKYLQALKFSPGKQCGRSAKP